MSPPSTGLLRQLSEFAPKIQSPVVLRIPAGEGPM